MSPITAYPSIKLNQLIPQHIRLNYPLFYEFLKLYLEIFEEEGKGYEFLASLQKYGDIDETTAAFLENSIKEKLGKLDYRIVSDDTSIQPYTLNKRTLIKNIRQYYRATGSEKAFKFLFNAKYREEIEIYYPWDDVLKVSQSKWAGSYQLLVPYDPLIPKCINGTIVGQVSGSKGLIEKVGYLKYSDGTETSLITIKDYDPSFPLGGFIAGGPVTITSIDGAIVLTDVELFSSVVGFDFVDTGMFLSVNDPIYIGSGDGIDANYSIYKVSRGGINNLKIVRKGTGYAVGDKIHAIANDVYGDDFAAIITAVDHLGGILKYKIYNEGYGYANIPFISIHTANGSGAILQAEGNIGKILEVKAINGGINYFGSPEVTSYEIITYTNDLIPFIPNRYIEGLESGSTAYINEVDINTKKLKTTEVSGDFIPGEPITTTPYGIINAILGGEVNNSNIGFNRIVGGIYREIIIPTDKNAETLALLASDNFNASVDYIKLTETDMYILNGEFESNYGSSQPWSIDTGWVIENGIAKATDSGTLSQQFMFPVGETFKIEFDILAIDNANFYCNIEEFDGSGITPQNSSFVVTPGHYETYVRNDNDTQNLIMNLVATKLVAEDEMVLELDNVTVYPSNNYIANSNFRTSSFWTTNDWLIVVGKARSFNTTDSLSQSVSIQDETYYRLSFVLGQVDDNTPVSGTLAVSLNGNQTEEFSEPGNYSVTLKSGIGAGEISFISTNFTGALDDVFLSNTDHLMINDSFDLGFYGWTVVNDDRSASGWEHDAVNEYAQCIGTHVSNVYLSRTVSSGVTPGDYFLVESDVTITSGWINIIINGYRYPMVDGQNDHYYIVGDSTELSIVFEAGPGFEGTLDNVIARKVLTTNPETYDTDVITDGDFAIVGAWTFGDDGNVEKGWYADFPVVRCDGDQQPEEKVYFEQSLPDLVEGNTYSIYINVSEYYSGTVWPEIVETGFENIPRISEVGSYSFDFRAGVTNTLRINADDMFSGAISHMHITASTNLVVNNHFDIPEGTITDSDKEWTKNGVWDISTPGLAEIKSSTGNLTQTIVTEIGKKYTATIEIEEITEGGIRFISDDDSILYQQFQTEPGVYLVEFVGIGNDHLIGVTCDGITSAKIHAIFVQESSELITNPDFESSFGWTNTTNWVFDVDEENNGIITHSEGTEDTLTQNNVLPLESKNYNVEINVKTLGGTIPIFYVYLGSSSDTYRFPIDKSGITSFSIMSGTTGEVIIKAPADCDVVIDSISVKAPDQLVVNGEFESGLGWSLGTGWSISGGKANHSGSSGYISTTISNVTLNQPYLLEYQISNTISAIFMEKYKIDASTINGSITYTPGQYISFEGHLNYDKYIQDSYYFQKFSYQINSTQSSQEWKPSAYKIHPAGTKLFGNDDIIANRLISFYVAGIGPWLTTLQLYKFDENTPHTQVKTFAEYNEPSVVYRPRIKTNICPGSTIEITQI